MDSFCHSNVEYSVKNLVLEFCFKIEIAKLAHSLKSIHLYQASMVTKPIPYYGVLYKIK